MQFVAKAKHLPFSPYKLRPIADVVRGKSAEYALNWLATYKTQRVTPLQKVIASAVANAKSLAGLEAGELVIKDIRVDEAGIHKYFKAGAMGRGLVQRRGFAHASV